MTWNGHCILVGNPCALCWLLNRDERLWLGHIVVSGYQLLWLMAMEIFISVIFVDMDWNQQTKSLLLCLKWSGIQRPSPISLSDLLDGQGQYPFCFLWSLWNLSKDCVLWGKLELFFGCRWNQVSQCTICNGPIDIPIIKSSVNWWNTSHQPGTISRYGTSIHVPMPIPILSNFAKSPFSTRILFVLIHTYRLQSAVEMLWCYNASLLSDVAASILVDAAAFME